MLNWTLIPGDTPSGKVPKDLVFSLMHVFDPDFQVSDKGHEKPYSSPVFGRSFTWVIERGAHLISHPALDYMRGESPSPGDGAEVTGAFISRGFKSLMFSPTPFFTFFSTALFLHSLLFFSFFPHKNLFILFPFPLLLFSVGMFVFFHISFVVNIFLFFILCFCPFPFLPFFNICLATNISHLLFKVLLFSASHPQGAHGNLSRFVLGEIFLLAKVTGWWKFL